MLGNKTPAATPEYREGWARVFAKPAKKRRPTRPQQAGAPHAKPGRRR